MQLKTATFLLLSALLPSLTSADSCEVIACATGALCTTDAYSAMECIKTIPLNNTWAEATLDVLSQSLENFGFGPLFHKTGPPYSIELDVLGLLDESLAALNSGSFTNDYEFQENVQSIFIQTLDAHTKYNKPECYNINFVQPFTFEVMLPEGGGTEPKGYLQLSSYTDQYTTQFPTVNYNDIIGEEIKLLNGVEFQTAVSTWGDSHEIRSNHPSARFNAALRSYLSRNAISVNLSDDSVEDDLVVTLADGRVFAFPWMGVYREGFGDVAVCGLQEAVEAVEGGEVVESVEAETSGRRHLFEEPPAILSKEILHDDRSDRVEIVASDDPYFVSCFVQTVTGSDADTAEVQKVLVMKVSSFSPPGDYQDAWAGFLGSAEKCLSVDFDLVVVDVMQNGGGYVCLGLRLLELLIEDYNDDHTKVQMHYDLPHSPLMDKFIETVNYPDP